MKKTKNRTLTVRGKAPFPTDMLRRDCCYPHRQEDVWTMNAIEVAIEMRDAKTEFEVTVAKENDREWTVERWLSFGWTPVVKELKGGAK